MSGGDYVSERACEETSTKIFAKLESIERRLFKDNGTLSIQTRLDRHEQVIRVSIWMMSIIGGAFLTYLVFGIGFIMRFMLQS